MNTWPALSARIPGKCLRGLYSFFSLRIAGLGDYFQDSDDVSSVTISGQFEETDAGGEKGRTEACMTSVF